jgi:hypothetical protein
MAKITAEQMQNALVVRNFRRVVQDVCLRESVVAVNRDANFFIKHISDPSFPYIGQSCVSTKQ